MTDAEWLACTDPRSMLAQLDGASPRKLQLFAIACARRTWHLLEDELERRALVAAERCIEGEATEEERQLHAIAWSDQWFSASYNADNAAGSISRHAFDEVANTFADVLATPEELARAQAAAKAAWGDERKFQAHLLRDIFPRATLPDSETPWRTATVIRLAQGIYTDRAFERLPILADALEDAGNADAAMLRHCRDEQIHVRGCWVIDLVLGRH